MTSNHPLHPDEPPRIRSADVWVSDALGVFGVVAWRWEAATGRVTSTAANGPCNLEELVAQVHGDDRERWRAAFQQARDRGEPWTCPFRLAPNGAGIRWVEERGRAWLDRDGRPAGAVALRADAAGSAHSQATATERPPGDGERAAGSGGSAAALEVQARSEGFLDAALESMSDGLLLIAADGRVTRTNRRARELLRCDGAPLVSIEELLAGLRVFDTRGNPVPRGRLPSALALRGETTHGIGLVVQFSDGQRVRVSAGAAPIRGSDGAVVSAVLTLTDPVHFPEAQEPREDLARMISQHLRPPLGAILVQAKLLGRRLSEGLQAVRSRSEAILQSAQRMGAILNDLVESALLEAGRLRLELASVDLLDMVRNLRGRLPAGYDGGRIRIEPCHDLPRVLADPNRLERVLVNLLTGALKRSPPGAQVVVRLAAGPGEVVLEVEDEGERIELAFPDGFDPQPPAPAPGQEDHRLELYTARVLVEAHGGTITADGVAERGNLVRVRLPLRPPGAA
jgi:signal transduction histidine kinase